MRQLLTLLFVMSSFQCFGSGIVVDDFMSGPLNVTLSPSFPSLNQNQTGLVETSAIGGLRRHTALLNPPIDPDSEATIVIDESVGTYRIHTNADMEAYALAYGLRTLAEGSGEEALNLDLAGYDAFRIDVITSEVSDSAFFSLRSGTNESNIDSESYSITFPSSSSPYSIFIPLSQFSLSNVEISDIDSITITGFAPAGFDLTLGGIYVVPEPSTATLILVCASGLIMRQKRT